MIFDGYAIRRRARLDTLTEVGATDDDTLTAAATVRPVSSPTRAAQAKSRHQPGASRAQALKPM